MTENNSKFIDNTENYFNKKFYKTLDLKTSDIQSIYKINTKLDISFNGLSFNHIFNNIISISDIINMYSNNLFYNNIDNCSIYLYNLDLSILEEYNSPEFILLVYKIIDDLNKLSDFNYNITIKSNDIFTLNILKSKLRKQIKIES